MQELEKIIEKMKEIKDGNRKEKIYAKYPPNGRDQEILNAYSQGYEDGTDNFYNAIVDDIRKHMNDGWIPVEEKLPEDDGEYCTQYQIMTKYGVTEGWYHPNENVWYVLLWRHLRENGEIDFEKGDIPTLELINPEIRTDIIIAWMPLPEPYHPEELERREGE